MKAKGIRGMSVTKQKSENRHNFLVQELIRLDVYKGPQGQNLYEMSLFELEMLYIDVRCQRGRDISDLNQEPENSTISLQLVSTDWGQANLNPMVRAFGAIRDKKCIGCKHLIKHKLSKTYYKCGLRTVTNGPSTDHKAHWIACSKYEGK